LTLLSDKAQARLRKLLRAALLLLAVGLASSLSWYVLVRIVSPFNALKIRSSTPASPTRQRPPGHLRILAYNICHCRGNDLELVATNDQAALDGRMRGIAEFLRHESPDIAVLNEVDFDATFTGRMNQAGFFAKEGGFPYWVEQRNIDVDAPFIYTDRFGNAVLSRLPIARAQVIRLPALKRWESIVAGHANALLCELGLPEGRAMRFLGVHLESRSEETRAASVDVIEAVRDSSAVPLVVAGDMNSTPKGFPESRQHNGLNALSLLLDSGAYATLPHGKPSEQDFTGRTAGRKSVIDWILVPSDWRILSRRVVPLPWSDHKAVVMDVVPN